MVSTLCRRAIAIAQVCAESAAKCVSAGLRFRSSLSHRTLQTDSRRRNWAQRTFISEHNASNVARTRAASCASSTPSVALVSHPSLTCNLARAVFCSLAARCQATPPRCDPSSSRLEASRRAKGWPAFEEDATDARRPPLEAFDGARELPASPFDGQSVLFCSILALIANSFRAEEKASANGHFFCCSHLPLKSSSTALCVYDIHASRLHHSKFFTRFALIVVQVSALHHLPCRALTH